jgi:predicted ATP-grasp superfamily ATP-dependent carboligase
VFVNGAGIVREMARKGAYVVAVDSDKRSPGLQSRHANEKVLVPSPGEAPGAFTEFLLQRDDLRGALVIPTDDFYLRELYENRGALESDFILCISGGDAVKRALHKDLAEQAANEAGVDIPKSVTIEATENIREALDVVGLPAIVKPVFSISFHREFKKKVFEVASGEQLREALARVRGGGHRVSLQEVIPGGDERMFVHCSYWNGRGECVGEYVFEKTLQYPPIFGVGQFVTVVRQEAVAGAARRLLGHMGYAGAVAATEFKLDPRDGRPKLVDINTRSPMQAALGRPAGCDVLDMLWRDKLGLKQLPPGKIRYGKTWTYLKNGILRYRGYAEHRLPWWRYVGHLASQPTFALLSLSDPRPFLTDIRPLLHRRLGATPS